MLKDLLTAVKKNKILDIEPKTAVRARRLTSFISGFVDFIVLGVVRVIFLMLAALYANKYRIDLLSDIKRDYGGIENFNLTKKDDFLYFANSEFADVLFTSIVVIVAIGFFYRVFMWISPWRATVGQRFTKTIVVREIDGSNLSVFDALSRAILLYAVWLFPFFIILYWKTKKYISIIFLVLTSVWSDTSFLFNKSRSLTDVITGTVCIYGSSRSVSFFYWFGGIFGNKKRS
ncbi:MAG: hypothetical protein JJW01_00610 [Alphaproteobacteria bacterium]|nr:hypothetical protein [Rickettsiales bacterium]